MEKKLENSVYVTMMADSLKRKEKILTFIYEKTREQETLLKDEELDVDAFQKLVDEKGERIDELNELDEGFDALFQMVEKEIVANRGNYAEEIQDMQKTIASVSELGVKIQALEHQNSGHLKIYLSKKRKQIRDFHVNNKTAANYYSNMSNTHKPEQSYFFNEKK
ncbi:MAG: hypothetical protein J1F22_07200 [Lachnospiraceae bacterium]|nr:hypothetical protein [Lachnospiraceae bacterium]